jgi:hypothetical protein
MPAFQEELIEQKETKMTSESTGWFTKALLGVVILLAVANFGIYLFWVPKFLKVYCELWVALPMITQVSISLSQMVALYAWIFAPVFCLGIMLTLGLVTWVRNVLYAGLAFFELLTFGVGLWVELPLWDMLPHERALLDYVIAAPSREKYENILATCRQNPALFQQSYETGILHRARWLVVHFLGESRDRQCVPFLKKAMENWKQEIKKYEFRQRDPLATLELAAMAVALYRLDNKLRKEPFQDYLQADNPNRSLALFALAIQEDAGAIEELGRSQGFSYLERLTGWRPAPGEDPAKSWETWWDANRGNKVIRPLSSWELHWLLLEECHRHRW